MDEFFAIAVGAGGVTALVEVQRFIEATAAGLPAGWAQGYLNVMADDVRRVTGEPSRPPNAQAVPLRACS